MITSPAQLLFAGITDTSVIDVLVFACEAHNSQKRKYTNEPYITHPIGVAQLVHDHCLRNGEDYKTMCTMIKGALLHDVVEDCGVSLATIYTKFGSEVRDIVFWLTAPSKELVFGQSNTNRALRKKLDHAFLSEAPPKVLAIKAMDIVHNGQTIFLNDKNFGPLYLDEVTHLFNLVSDKVAYRSCVDEWWKMIVEQRELNTRVEIKLAPPPEVKKSVAVLLSGHVDTTKHGGVPAPVPDPRFPLPGTSL